jgi:UDP-glucose 4-epimerase
VDALVAADHDVTAFDRFSGDRTAFASAAPVRLAGDFLSRSDLEAAVVGQDLVFHVLSTTTPAISEADPTLDIRTNLAQTVELLESCAHAGVRHVYFASTGGAIYGSQGRADYREEDRALPISPYGIGKLSVEHYLHYFRARFGLRSTSLRISNPYGPRQRINRRQGLIPIVLRQVLLEQPVVRYGDGSMVRDYLFVDDLIRMIMAMVNAGTAGKHDLYNIGSGVGHSIDDVLQAIRSVTGRDFAIEDLPSPPTFVDRVVLNTTRFRTEFGDLPITPLNDGIARTWADMQEHWVA